MQGMAAQMLQVHQELQQRMCSPWDALFPRKPVGGSLSRLLQLWDYEASLTMQVTLCSSYQHALLPVAGIHCSNRVSSPLTAPVEA